MRTHDIDGVEYAKISEVKPGDILIADSGFTCMEAGPVKVRRRRDGSLFVHCTAKYGHDLDGQLEDGEHLIGMTRPA
jgi:hypothetical protein